ncbi:MAG TPA: S49 family peptidase [Kiloniellaceae bacterium]|nr:S49 family peptidase [Kiloniellaceae bacterium]
MDIVKYLRFLPIKRFREPPPRVAVLRLSGAIGSFGPLRQGLTLAGLEATIARAFEIPRLNAVALAVNSPGGSPVQSELIAGRIRALAKEKDLPVFAFCEDVAASGGYWLALAGDKIFASENSIVGSIGVISAGFGFPALIERVGIERRVHTSGTRKSILDPFKAEDPDDVARLESLQREIHDSFISWVRERRGEALKSEAAVLFSGEFWSGRRAAELGLVDGIGDLRSELRSRFGDKVELIPVKQQKRWWRRPFGGAALAEALPSTRDWAAGLLAAAEERALWGRYGL